MQPAKIGLLTTPEKMRHPMPPAKMHHLITPERICLLILPAKTRHPMPPIRIQRPAPPILPRLLIPMKLPWHLVIPALKLRLLLMTLPKAWKKPGEKKGRTLSWASSGHMPMAAPVCISRQAAGTMPESASHGETAPGNAANGP